MEAQHQKQTMRNESHFRPRNKSSKKITPVLPRAGGLRGCFNGIKCILWYTTQYLTIGISYHCSIPNAIYPRAKKPRGEGHEKTLQRHWQWWTTGKNILWTILQLLMQQYASCDLPCRKKRNKKFLRFLKEKPNVQSHIHIRTSSTTYVLQRHKQTLIAF